MTTPAFTESFVVQENEDNAYLTECVNCTESKIYCSQTAAYFRVTPMSISLPEGVARDRSEHATLILRFKCVYGDAVICDDGSSYAYET